MTPTKIAYEKRKNKELFKQFETNAYLSVSNSQNYSPVYKRYFDLNETNYNNINLNHKWHLNTVDASINNSKCYQCSLVDKDHKKTKNVFFKMAPLLDPYKYMSGRYVICDSLLQLPTFAPNSGVHPKIMDPNNASYVDGFFYYLSNRLLEQGFVNGIEYYGSFIGMKNQFTCNIIDDIEYLSKSDFFNKHKGVLFDTPDYSNLLCDDENNSMDKKRQPLIHIGDENVLLEMEDLNDNNNNKESIHCDNVMGLEEVEINVNPGDHTTTIHSSSSCSSRTSHTNSSESGEEDDDDWSTESNEDGEEDSSSSEETYYDDDETLDAMIPKFPVQMIAMEHCYNTLDHLIRSDKLETNELFAIMMQVVMILITYQQVYSMTHNDLHTNNIMYVPTESKYLYYCFNKTYYKVPTHGRIFKIIDFGRAIYKFDNVLFCSDSFQAGEDAATQYNTEPYMNENKPRLDPNPSFDLCRLACSIFDYFIQDMRDVKDKCENDAFVRVMVEWCLDDNKMNVLYKNNGAERYPEFKLYKMIARHVHHHTPQAQLERKEFSRYAIAKESVKKGEHVMNIDEYC